MIVAIHCPTSFASIIAAVMVSTGFLESALSSAAPTIILSNRAKRQGCRNGERENPAWHCATLTPLFRSGIAARLFRSRPSRHPRHRLRRIENHTPRRTADHRLDRASGPANAHAVLADDQRCGGFAPLAPYGCDARPAAQHSLSTCGRLIGAPTQPGKPHTRSVLPVVPAERAAC